MNEGEMIDTTVLTEERPKDNIEKKLNHIQQLYNRRRDTVLNNLGSDNSPNTISFLLNDIRVKGILLPKVETFLKDKKLTDYSSIFESLISGGVDINTLSKIVDENTDQPLYNKLLSFYADHDRPDIALEAIKRHSDVSNYEKILNKCARAGKTKEVFELIKVSPYIEKFDSLLTTCLDETNADEIFQLIKNHPDLSNFVYSLNGCIKFGKKEEVFKLIENQTDLKNFELVLSNLMYDGLHEEVYNLIIKHPDLESLDSLLSTACNYGHMGEIFALITERDSITSFTSTLEVCAEQYPDKVFALVKNEDLSNYSIRSLLSTCAKYGKLNEVLEIFDKQSDKSPDLAFALNQAVTPDTAPSILKFIDKQQDIVPFITTIISCAKDGVLPEAFEMLSPRLDSQSIEDIINDCLQSNLTTEIISALKKLPSEKIPEKYRMLLAPYNEIKDTYQTTSSLETGQQDLIQEIIKDLPEQDRPLLLHQLNDLFQDLNLTSPELFLLKLIVKKHSFWSNRVKDMLTNKTFAAGIEKTHSELLLFTPLGHKRTNELGEVVFANRIPYTSAEIWRELHDAAIPVAPITADFGRTNQNDFTTVFSRYCGVTYESLNNILNTDVFLSIKDDLDQQKKTILQEVEKRKIKHGHSHDRNFVVEFIKKDYYQQQMQEYAENVNKIVWNKDSFTGDIFTYYEHQDEYVPVVRLIDWDLSYRTNALDWDSSALSN